MKALLIAAALAVPFAAVADDTKAYEKPKTSDPAYPQGPPPGAEITTPPSDLPKTPDIQRESGLEPSQTESFTADAAVNKLNKVTQKNIELGDLAKTRASNTEVKKFGEKIAKDHKKLNDQVSSYAKKKNITLSGLETATSGYASDPGMKTQAGAQAGVQSGKMGTQAGTQAGMQSGSMGSQASAGTEPSTEKTEKAAESAEKSHEFAMQLDELKNLTGPEFDSKFLGNVVDNADRSLSKLQSYKGVGDKELDALIDKAAKIIGEEQKEAKKLQGKLPAV